MKPALWLLAAALPLVGQPKLLVNAKLDTRSAAAGLEREFKALLAAPPQPSWIMYQVPAVRSYNLGCDYVRDSFAAPGVIHLEPPDHAVILFRVEGNNVTRIRTLSPDCEIDAADFPVHWLTDVTPSQSVALLATFVPLRESDINGCITAIALHADPAADNELNRLIGPNQPEWLRRRTASLIGSTRGAAGVGALKNLIATDLSDNVRESAISGLSGSKDPAALDLLIATARNERSPKIRAQAISALNRKPGQAVVDTLQNAVNNDTDQQVRRRAVDALGSLPDGAGVPALIQFVKTSKEAEIRKQAMSALQRTHDSRAEAFFSDVLK